MVRDNELHAKIYRFIDRAFLGPKIDTADFKITQAYYPGGGGWRYDHMIMANDPDENYRKQRAWEKTEIAPANTAWDQASDHREFRINALKWAVAIWTATGLLSCIFLR